MCSQAAGDQSVTPFWTFFHWQYQNLGIFLVSTGTVSAIFLPDAVLELLSFNIGGKVHTHSALPPRIKH